MLKNDAWGGGFWGEGVGVGVMVVQVVEEVLEGEGDQPFFGVICC